MKIKKSALSVCLWIMFLSTPHAGASTVLLENVPAYKWYHGCGPTAAASILGYWDLNGYDSLFDATGWENIRLTSNVQDEISSPAHNKKYENGDDPNLPEPLDTSIADFFHTSEFSLPDGSSYFKYSDDVFTGYAAYRGYGDWDAWYEMFNVTFTWEDLVEQIDNGYPMMFFVDSDGTEGADHFVSVFGYDDESGLFAFYNGWGEGEDIEDISWASFLGIRDGRTWGIAYAIFIEPGIPDTAVPEPSTVLYMFLGLAFGLARLRKMGS